MKQDQAIKKLPLMNKFEAMVLIRINKEKQLAYAYMIQDSMLSKEISSSSEGRTQNFMSEYPSLKIDNDDRCHGTLLRQELQEPSQRKVLSVITNFEDQSDQNHYILQETVYYLIQEVMLSNERSSSSEGIRQRFKSEYPWQKSDEDNRHSTLLSQELQKLSQSKVLSVLTNVDDQTDHHLYILQGSLCHLYILQETIIQEAMLSKERMSSSEGRSQRFISEHILSKYPSLKNNKDDLHHTTLLGQELTQRKVISLIINVEDQSANHYILQETLSYENTDAANYPLLKISLLYLLLLRAANYPLVIAQQLQEGRHEEDNNNDIGIMEKKAMKLKYKSAREINRRMDDGVEGTGTNANVEEGTFDDGQVTRIEKNSLRRTDPNTVDEPKDDAGEEVVGEEEHQEEARVEEEGQEEEYQEEVGGEGQRDEDEGDQDEDEEENGDEDEDMNEEEEDEDEDMNGEEEDEDDKEEVLLGEEGEAIVETVLDKLDVMVAIEAKAVVEELADEMELEELEERMVDKVKERIEGRLGDETEKIIATQEAEAFIAKAKAENRIVIQEAAEKAPALIAKLKAVREDEEKSKAELANVEALHAKAKAKEIAIEQAEAALVEAQISGRVITAKQLSRAIEAAAVAAAKAAVKAAKDAAKDAKAAAKAAKAAAKNAKASAKDAKASAKAAKHPK